jgi:hypothetical protein
MNFTRTNQYYSSVEEVISYTGIRYDDLGLESEEELAWLLEQWLIQAKDFIDKYIERNLHKELESGKLSEIPPSIHNVATRIVANMVTQAVIRRQTPIANKDNVSTITVSDSIFTDSIKQDLEQFKIVSTSPALRIKRVRSRSEREGEMQ